MRHSTDYLHLSVPPFTGFDSYCPEPWHVTELMFWIGAGIGFFYFGFNIVGGFCLGCAFGAYWQRRSLCLNSVRELR